ncbi:MAG: enoyl-CoA hydratase-related protein [Desulfitobacteriaceae bacterium]|nr:enoyl-CoA hydratase-related protein [Desulfitobacteriaceae bacterium]MDD4345428.1 enoyl-CoA hydratase-related protein [Desulfitobacteriaceae bacterium]MDD4400725.1 enoyl-CoA hydratase-related protein [Desulfitobacteriaceae bacterium]
MDYKEILCTEKEGTYRIVLNRPESLNSLSNLIIDELKSALNYAADCKGIRVIVLAGAGRAFSAGGDLETIKNSDALSLRDYVEKIGGIIKLVTSLEKPVIAEVSGVAVGSGCNLAIAADIVIAGEKARFGQGFLPLAFVNDGGGTYLMPRLIGLRKAQEIILTGKMLSAEEAEKIGLITKVVRMEELENAVMEIAGQLAASAPRALGFTKLLLNRSFALDLNETLAYEAYIQGICKQTNDHKEGLDAFANKRSPNFSGN